MSRNPTGRRGLLKCTLCRRRHKACRFEMGEGGIAETCVRCEEMDEVCSGPLVPEEDSTPRRRSAVVLSDVREISLWNVVCDLLRFLTYDELRAMLGRKLAELSVDE